MAISSRDIVPRNEAAPVSSKSVRALARREDHRRSQVAIRAMDREYDAIDHRHFAETVLLTAELDTVSVANFAANVRDVVDGDALVASMVTPIMNAAVNAVQKDLRRTFGM